MAREQFINDVRGWVQMASSDNGRLLNVWLPPKIVENYCDTDFQDVDASLQSELKAAIEEFKKIDGVKAHHQAAVGQPDAGREAIERIQEALRKIVEPEWRMSVEGLTKEVETWAKAESWSSHRDVKQLEDSLLGKYLLPRLRINTVDGQFVLDPITRFAPETTGIVDLFAISTGDSVLLARTERGEWRVLSPRDEGEDRAWNHAEFVSSLGALAHQST